MPRVKYTAAVKRKRKKENAQRSNAASELYLSSGPVCEPDEGVSLLKRRRKKMG